MTDPKRLISQIETITMEAGEIILGYFTSAFDVNEKSADNPVTDADLAADAYLKEKLTALLPEAAWLSEETADSPERLKSGLIWIVDPLDGTKEFVMGIPEFCVSVALVDQGEAVAGVIYNPVTKELYSATKEGGCMLNGVPAHVTQTALLSNATVEASRSERRRGEFEPFEGLTKVETMGSIAYKLARVAAGQADATWSRGPKHEWDICAGVLLIKAAGGDVVDLDYNAFWFNQIKRPKVSGIIATNQKLHAEIIDILAQYRDTARQD